MLNSAKTVGAGSDVGETHLQQQNITSVLLLVTLCAYFDTLMLLEPSGVAGGEQKINKWVICQCL